MIVFIRSHCVVIVGEIDSTISSFKTKVDVLSISSHLFSYINSKVRLPCIDALSIWSSINEFNRVPNTLLQERFDNSLGNVICTIEDNKFRHILHN
jgi:hypothetical protein